MSPTDPHEIPCRWCIKMTAETCRTTGKCMHRTFCETKIDFGTHEWIWNVGMTLAEYDRAMTLPLGDCANCDGYIISEAERPYCPTCAREKRERTNP